MATHVCNCYLLNQSVHRLHLYQRLSIHLYFHETSRLYMLVIYAFNRSSRWFILTLILLPFHVRQRWSMVQYTIKATNEYNSQSQKCAYIKLRNIIIIHFRLTEVTRSICLFSLNWTCSLNVLRLSLMVCVAIFRMASGREFPGTPILKYDSNQLGFQTQYLLLQQKLILRVNTTCVASGRNIKDSPIAQGW